ncbi:MAG TPA: ankyrin repeat domain-containing protein [Candidatus Sulfopaludibacter sp.]|jgi:truncated hemoglobin YjbI|nr:ankyrin repeat domain-containing protein [Candidatus Sulfopaludibacter sp.]
MAATDLFEAIGGSAKCYELSAAFYARAAKDPTLRPFFPGKTQRCAIEAFAAFLVQFLGGPVADTQHRWFLSLRESHARFEIGERERGAWMEQMTKALRDVDLSESLRRQLREFFETASGYLVNRGPADAPARVHGEMGALWDEQRALDEAVQAVRQGDLARMIALVEGPLLQARFQRSSAVFAQFVGVLMGSEYALQLLQENPSLARQYFSGRTLLHVASAAGDLPFVTTLLHYGVDPNILDGGGHTPLYCVANECPGGAAIVNALVHAGADVHACDGAKRCTALHMAARRGNVEAAAALLDCGANLEARDTLRETPLRRAVNCGQTAVAALLLARGADPHSIGSKGLTPISAARSAAMRVLLQARR